MTQFSQLSDRVWASPQIDEGDVAEAARLGFTLVINNRPDGEAEDQPSGDVIERAARAAGLEYVAIPITHAGFSAAQVDEMEKLLDTTPGKTLAYCRSGTRSTLLWALARAQAGEAPEALAEAAREAGYDVSPVRPAMDMLSASSGG